jgi:hypothetical protein
MAIYLGNSEKLKVNLDGIAYYLNWISKLPITNGIRLLSLENHILKDNNGLFLTTKEEK